MSSSEHANLLSSLANPADSLGDAAMDGTDRPPRSAVLALIREESPPRVIPAPRLDPTGQSPLPGATRVVPSTPVSAGPRAGPLPPATPFVPRTGAASGSTPLPPPPALGLGLPRTSKEILESFRALKLRSDQVESTGTISFPSYTHPRSISTRTLWPAYLGNDQLVLYLDEAQRSGKYIVWASAYKTMDVTTKEIALLRDGLNIIGTESLVANWGAGDYLTVEPPARGKAFIIVAKDADACRRLVNKKVITVRSPTKAATFFLQHDDSWASHIVFDIHNAGSDFLRDVLVKLYQSCKRAIALSDVVKEGFEVFKDLAYYKVPWNPKTHKGAKGIIWRVRFLPSEAASHSTWALPRTLGKSNKGVIEVRRSPLCSHCISYSHAQSLCQWWKEGLVAGSKTPPKDQMEATWIRIPHAPLAKLLG